MVGDIKAISPCVKSASAKLFLDLHTVSAPSGEERTLDAAAQVERTGWCCRRFDSGTHAWCGHATVMVLVSSASGPRVSGCTRAPRYFGPHPVRVTHRRGGGSIIYTRKSRVFALQSCSAAESIDSVTLLRGALGRFTARWGSARAVVPVAGSTDAIFCCMVHFHRAHLSAHTVSGRLSKDA